MSNTTTYNGLMDFIRLETKICDPLLQKKRNTTET